ncbi:sensor histidine kinase [Candidatus Chrysopegis kryptomonas]|uniref:histidine kinase n=1 Tax=Candidatus Chryseopegocella kryptomonas TaxID=1633643 RepID=A0A0P1MY49_9BACT|nr:ATP-binding protein [Candidatus Chrysopegis kryptomonas]CUT00968.1 two-component system, OmpR family, phosphate regulon sensor histidine kinase PhoR [Candidatus Chrysopegis kryptomonas]
MLNKQMRNLNIFIFFGFFLIVVLTLILKPALGLILSFIFALWCFKNLFEPLLQLNKQIKNFYNEKDAINEEISLPNLITNLRYLHKRFVEFEIKFKDYEEKFKTLNKIVSDAVLIIDKNGRIKQFNENFKTTFSKSGVIIEESLLGEGKLYWEVIRDFDLNEFIKSLMMDENLKPGQEISKEIEVKEKIYLINAVKTLNGDIILSLSDVSFQIELARIKRELVENISHELKTPLSNIKGYVETLEEELEKLAKRGKVRELLNYIDPIKRNTDRLVKIIKDLLILSEVEAAVKFEEEIIDFKSVVGGILKIYEREIKKKNLFCDVQISENLPRFKADPFRIEQMLSNLIDNAIRYTDKGGIKIKVEPLEETANKIKKIKITVEDTGIGIPKEHHQRIFERFYVVDKSRSRQSGGTGLGLSIVKHIVLMYNGSINLESKVGVGTKFEIILPVKDSDS